MNDSAARHSTRGEAARSIGPGRASGQQAGHDTSELVLFRVDDLVCGMDIRHVREILKTGRFTPVCRAPNYVIGLINLRGQIITLVDFRKIFSLPAPVQGVPGAIMVLSDEVETVGLLVDGVDDALAIELGSIQPPPANFSGVHGTHFLGVYQGADEVYPILDPRKVLHAAGN